MLEDIRSEQNIFMELAELCSAPGYANVIAYFCHRDNMIGYDGVSMVVENIIDSYSSSHLSRAEISTLIGLLVKSKIEYEMPPPKVFQSYVDKTEALFLELHHAINKPVVDGFKGLLDREKDSDPYSSGAAMREPIFYSGESAYTCQYRDLLPLKYGSDDGWFVSNKGYSIKDAAKICDAISKLVSEKIPEVLSGFIDGLPPHEWTILPAFCFSIEEVSGRTGIDAETVRKFLDSFVIPCGVDNSGFLSVSDFNFSNAYPVIRCGSDSYLVFQPSTLFESLYETPFYWFNSDKSYKNIAMENRGRFAEEFSYVRLAKVFGEDRVFKNVNIVGGGRVVGEIDVLVIFANRAIVVQAKSKKLTILSKQGNEFSLRDDFKKSVQDAYDQGFSCAQLLGDKSVEFYQENGARVRFAEEFKEIYLFCVVSDSYPALSFQARQFLKIKEAEGVMHPFVMDVFLLDVMTEFLDSPLLFLSYINRRVGYAEKIISTQELTILSYHLKCNLWVEDKAAMLMLHEDICADLDLAFLSRRDGVPGEEFPKGLLRKYKGTVVGTILNSIEHVEYHGTIELGFFLLKLGGDTIDCIEKGVTYVARLARQDRKHHDFLVAIDEGNSGITFHLNELDNDEGLEKLSVMCKLRKYAQKAGSWYGINIDPFSLRLRFGVGLEGEWMKNDEMEQVSNILPEGKDVWGLLKDIKGRAKIGRNDLCPCGSGLKYKKCCLR